MSHIYEHTDDACGDLCAATLTDINAFGTYACVCGLLRVCAQQIGIFPAHLGMGAVVGALSAFCLQMLRGMMGGAKPPNHLFSGNRFIDFLNTDR